MKKIVKQLTCLVLAICMLATSIPMDCFARTNEEPMASSKVKALDSYYYDGEKWSKVAKTKEIIDCSFEEGITEEEKENCFGFYDVESAGKYLREQMKKRNEHIVFKVYRDCSNYKLTDIYHMAVAHTGVSTEGDYLATIPDTIYNQGWVVKNFCSYDTYYRFDFVYRVSLEEEEYITTMINNGFYDVDMTNEDEERRACRGIYAWVTDCCEYDHDAYEKHEQGIRNMEQDKEAAQSYTAYGALVRNKAVCLGLASVIYRLMLKEGVNCRIITSSDHAWNAVEIDGEWYMCDATGDVKDGFRAADNYLISRSELESKGEHYVWNSDTMYDYDEVNNYKWAEKGYRDFTMVVARKFKKIMRLTGKENGLKEILNGLGKTKLKSATGKELKQGTNYDVSCEFGDYEVDGKSYNCMAVFTGKGDYAGEYKKYLNIETPAPKITKVTQKVEKGFRRDYYELTTKIYMDCGDSSLTKTLAKKDYCDRYVDTAANGSYNSHIFSQDEYDASSSKIIVEVTEEIPISHLKGKTVAAKNSAVKLQFRMWEHTKFLHVLGFGTGTGDFAVETIDFDGESSYRLENRKSYTLGKTYNISPKKLERLKNGYSEKTIKSFKDGEIYLQHYLPDYLRRGHGITS